MNTQSKNNNPWFYLLAGAIGVVACVLVGVGAWAVVNYPTITSYLGIAPAQEAGQPQPEILWAKVEVAKPLEVMMSPLDVGVLASSNELETTSTPSAADEPTTPPTDSPTLTATLEPTPAATETPAQLSMEIVPNTPTPKYVPPTNSPPNQVYASSGNGERWIDVDLSNQRVYAYEGDVVVNSFIVSTGVWATPTVTGQYRIYVKYVSAKMSGPGYYLPNVPYIMYFYKGYGLHGTYWHNNFGTPMSHGCVNLRTDDAAWLYSWASVGTLVNVHY